MSTTTPIDVQALLSAIISWKKVPGSPPTWKATVGSESCTLVMGDFPDESLYTVNYRGQSLELDDPPPSWTIQR